MNEHDEYRPKHEGDRPKDVDLSLVPENRSSECLLYRKIRKRIDAGYYNSARVLRDIAYILSRDLKK